MNRGMVQAYSSSMCAYWLGRAVAFRHSADSALGYGILVDKSYIKRQRDCMRGAAVILRDFIKAERAARKAAA